MNRSSCPPVLCICGYASLGTSERNTLTGFSQLTPKQVRDLSAGAILTLLNAHRISIDTANNFITPSGSTVSYLCRNTQVAIITRLGSSIYKLRQVQLDFGSDPDDEPMPFIGGEDLEWNDHDVNDDWLVGISAWHGRDYRWPDQD